MPRALRLVLIALAGLVLVAAIAAIVTVHVLLQPERFTAMLQRQARDAGLELYLAKPASPSLFPRPALELEGLTLSARDAGTPILLAANGRLVLPWRTLLGGDTVISQLEIDSPRVDLDALQSWLAELPPRADQSPIQIPSIDAGVLITRGSILRGNQLLMSDVTLQAGGLSPGRTFPLQLSARMPQGKPFQLRLSVTPNMSGQTLRLDNISLHLSQAPALSLSLDGEARWHGAANAALRLNGKLDQADTGSYQLAIALMPANQQDPLLLTVKVDGPDTHADLCLPPIAISQWWSQLSDGDPPRLTLPPGSGTIDIGKLDAGGVSIEGLHTETGVAPASSVNAPAATP